MREWKDEKTGRLVRQLTDHPGGVVIHKFKKPKLLPDGWVMAHAGKPDPGILLLHPESGGVKRVSIQASRTLRLRESDGRLWYVSPDSKTIWSVQLPDGKPECVGKNPAPPESAWWDVSCDGRTMVFARNEDDQSNYPLPIEGDHKQFWHYFSRPRRGSIWACDLATGKLTKVVETEGVCPIHIEPSRADPTLVRFCHDGYEAHCQRIWTVRTDGSELRKIRPQERGEDVVHEFWWPDGKAIGYKYMDRRKDETLHERPWCELSPMPLRLGIADLEGREFYLSDPLNCYHSHVYVSQDTKWLCGEGTIDPNFVYAARFSTRETKVDFAPMATIHTPCRLYVANHVNAAFSLDSRWLLYNDTVDGKLQVCAVRVEE